MLKQKLKRLRTVRAVLAAVWAVLLLALIATFLLKPPTAQPDETTDPADTTETATDPTQAQGGSVLEPNSGESTEPSGDMGADVEEDIGADYIGGGNTGSGGGNTGSGSGNTGSGAAGNEPPADGGEDSGSAEAVLPSDNSGIPGTPDVPEAPNAPGVPGATETPGASALSAEGMTGDGAEPGKTLAEAGEPDAPAESPERTVLLRWILMGLLALDTVAILAVSLRIHGLNSQLRAAAAARREQSSIPATAAAGGITVGKLHNIGARPGQQDSFGIDPFPGGCFAVVADGMGGLSGGEKVSQKIVTTMLCSTSGLLNSQPGNPLNGLVQTVNEEVNQMLGIDGQYKSGSTLVSVLVRGDRFHWISVGDSRIYLYRGGSLIQVNQEHTYEQELLRKAMDGQISFEEARSDPQRHRLTSFIGMGRLRYVDASLHSVPLTPGDRILLMSDGVFNTLPEQAMAAILASQPDVQRAAQLMEEQILNARAPAQDNFTAVILGV